MSSHYKNLSVHTPVFRGNKSNNSRRGIAKLTHRAFKTDKSQVKHSTAMISRKHKKNTKYYINECDGIEDMLFTYKTHTTHEDDANYSLICELRKYGIISQKDCVKINSTMIEQLYAVKALSRLNREQQQNEPCDK